MADLKKLMLDEIRKNTRIQSSYIDETEELIDTGLEKTDDNLTAVACAYLDEKGYRRRVDNLEIAKSKILETSEGYDTIIVKKNRIVETNIFEKATVAELRDALEVCLVNTIYSIHTKIDRLTNKQYEYKVEYVDSLKSESERPKQGHLGAEEFESFEETLNKRAAEGWELDKIQNEPKGNRVFLVFKREKIS
ncbi:MAG: DUF4177 domain-containing protein [Lachnospiraceae bacterium]|nr:DUF4177 domain-containing protein [Lachnospiraceae bacterium]MBP5275632.1 DUF4177 domain-containing protein [Lachnospiraceae bacterium]MBP5564832.1 DUF4177 domain-containing protein [Lachnospiraceae bacterium]MBQ4276256.1 DUF4177 domain-containing protein [Lachnospiraceae bacterium]